MLKHIDARWHWVLGITGMNYVLSTISPLHVVMHSLLVPLACASVFLAISAVYTYLRPDRGLAGVLLSAALFILLTNTLGIFSYLLGNLSHAPLIDTELAAFDRSLGFDWSAWRGFLSEPPALGIAMFNIYGSLGVELIVLILLLDPIGKHDRARELFLGFAAILTIELLIGYWFPAAGAFVQYATPEAHTSAYVQQFLALRDGSQRTVDVLHVEGILQFPSFHAALAVICSVVVRGIRWLAWPLWTLNLLVLISTPSCGGHYLADVLMGLLIALPIMRLICSRQSAHKTLRPSSIQELNKPTIAR